MKNYTVLISALFLIWQLPLFGQQHDIVFQQCYGGNLYEMAVGVHKTEDGFVVFGGNSSLEMPGNPENGVFWFFKADNTGEIIWEHAYGGSEVDYPIKLLPTNDKGYILFGHTSSIDGDVSGNHGMFDVWIIKTDSMGEMEWQRCYGGSQEEYAHDIIQTIDGGYIFTASAWSTDGGVGGGSPGFDAWLCKINAEGEIEWSQVFGGLFRDMGGHIIQTTDGGYMLTAQAYSPEVCPNAVPGANSDTWLLKLDASGEIEWQQCYGGSHDEFGGSIVQTLDGGYAFATPTRSNDGDVSGCMGIPGDPQSASLWFVKVDANGYIEWQRCLGGYGRDSGRIYGLTEEGNYLLGGSTTHSSGDINCSNIVSGKSSIWVFELSSSGEILWQWCLGNSVNTSLGGVHWYSPTNLLIAATINMADNDVDCIMNGMQDIWVVDLEDKGVGLVEPPITNSIEVYPNPATDQAWLQLPDNMPLSTMQVELYSPTGRLLYRAQPTGQFHKIDVANLPRGLYLVRVWDGERWMVEKLIVQ